MGRQMTTLDLPDPKDEPLARSPLTLVVCQVRHDRVMAAADPRRGLEVHGRLADRYPEVEQRSAILGALAFAGGGPPTVSHEQAPTGWQMKSSDAAWTVTLDPEYFSIETSAYTSWDDFHDRVDALVTAVMDVYEPALEVRIGLRFIDEIVDPQVDSPVGWKGWIRDELLGTLTHDAFGGAAARTQNIIELTAPDNYRVVLRHGTAPTDSGNWVYLLDHDCYRQAGRALTHDNVLATTSDLHTLALQVFQNAVTDELYRYLRGDA